MISCIITTYKREIDILIRAVNSVLSQTYKDIELIVVNDAPEDVKLSKSIGEALKNCSSKIKYIVHEKNMGACAARNTGIRHAKGEYIAFLDDDDEWVENKLELQLKVAEAENATLVYCSYYSIDNKGEMTIMRPNMKYIKGDTDFKRLLCFNFIGSTSFPLLRADALRAVKGFNEKLQSSQDHEAWLKIAKHYKITYIDRPLVKYYYSAVSITRVTEKRDQGYTYLLKEFKDDYQKYPDILHCRYMLLAGVYLGMKCYKKGLKYWGLAIKLDPVSSENFMIISRAIKKMFKFGGEK